MTWRSEILIGWRKSGIGPVLWAGSTPFATHSRFPRPQSFSKAPSPCTSSNPARFLSIARPLTPWFGWIGALLIAVAVVAGLFVTPQDYLQGESVRIMYVHVPAAWLGMGGWKIGRAHV
jgi:hypothetical protein